MTSVQETSSGLMLPASTIDRLPTIVRSELSKFSTADQQAFQEEFSRKAKGTGAAYLCSLFYCHYGYLGRWGMTVLMWVVSIATAGIVGVIWWIVDLFRMPGLVRNYNSDVALEVMRNLKTLRS